MSLRKLGAKQRQVAFSATSTFNQAPYYTAEFDGCLELQSRWDDVSWIATRP